MRYTPQGTAVTTFGLATNRSWKTEAGELREEVEFHRIVAWNKLAELCSQLLVKGRKVYVEGRLQTRTFTGSDNAQHTITEIVIEDMILLDSKRPEGVGAGAPGMSAPAVGSPAVVPTATTTPAPADTSAAPAPAADDGKKGTKKTKDATEEKKEVAKKDQPVNEDVNVDDIPF